MDTKARPAFHPSCRAIPLAGDSPGIALLYAGLVSDPICCPVCGNRELQTILRKAVSAGAGDDESRVIAGVLAYRCSNGHLFTTFNNDEALDQGLQGN